MEISYHKKQFILDKIENGKHDRYKSGFYCQFPRISVCTKESKDFKNICCKK
jgi:hypothetical protein